MRRLLVLAGALLALAAAPRAQEAPDAAPRVEVTLAPEGPVTVGTPVEVTATVLVPSYMPDPPAWPDLEIADAITRAPDRATHPVTRRIGAESWSGVARRWEIIPQRPAEYDLGPAGVAITYADPETNQPVSVTLPLPGIAFSARLPEGAEGMDPFVPATALTLTAKVDGLAEAPKPGDAFTLTLTTSASGPPAILLPPLAPGIATPEGLRAYPKEPALTDTPGDPPTATRVEAITYVIEAPGAYALPGLSLDWWNTATGTRETARTDPVSLSVAAPPGWQAGGAERRFLPWFVLLGLLVGAGTMALLARRRHPAPPSEARLYRALRHAIRAGRPAELRPALRAWLARAAPEAREMPPAIEAALRPIERAAYGGAADEPPGGRAALRSVVAAERREVAERPVPAALPALNPPGTGSYRSIN